MISHAFLLVAFNIFVLATGSWPLQAPNSNFNIPNEVIQSINYFKGFYESKYQGRKLTYLQHLSRAETDMRAVKGKVSFTHSFFIPFAALFVCLHFLLDAL